MTRIGFVFNQKPEPVVAPHAASEAPAADEEPPSPSRDSTLAAPTSAASTSRSTVASAPASSVAPDDEYAEWDTPETIDAVARALAQAGTVIRLEATRDLPARLVAADVDIVFNIAEGRRGPNREAHVPAICEFLDVPYTASDPFTCALCLDKARTKETLAFHGVPTAPFAVVREAADLDALLRGRAADARGPALPPLDALFPAFAKPVHEGSSKGITERSYCEDARALERTTRFLLETYRQPVLVETFLPGAEFTVAVLGNGRAARCLPLVGMNFGALPAGALPIYGFEAKWQWDTVDDPLDMFDCPARVSDDVRAAVERVALDAYRVLGCRDWGRVDVRLDAAGVPNVVEVNPLPGILPDPRDNSCLPKAARAAGMSYDALILACLEHALDRHGLSGRRAAPR